MSVIASAARQSKAALRFGTYGAAASQGLWTATACGLAVTVEGCHCERSAAIQGCAATANYALLPKRVVAALAGAAYAAHGDLDRVQVARFGGN